MTSAWVQFQVDESDSTTTNLTIEGEAADAAGTFTGANDDVSGRSRTSAAVARSPPAWTTVGAAGPDQQTPDLAAIVQEIVDEPGWASGNPLVLILTGTGERTAESYNGSATGAPLLHLEYSTVPIPNRAPIATNDAVTTQVGSSVTIDVVANDTDPDGNLDAGTTNVSCANCSTPSSGSLINNGDGSFDYLPETAFIGSDGFVYEVCDTEGVCAVASVSITVTAAAPQVVEVRVASASDDAEERDDGNVSLNSSDLELVADGSRGDQTVGMRFVGVGVPIGATITAAWVQFQSDEAGSTATDLAIEGQMADNPSTFINSNGDISQRLRTNAVVGWSPPAWNTVGVAGLDQRSPDLSGIIQEIVASPGWVAGNAIVVIITGTGRRTAESYNGLSSAAPLLHIEYALP